MKIILIILTVIIFSNCNEGFVAAKTDPEVRNFKQTGVSIKIPDNIFGVDFCVINLKEIISRHENMKIKFTKHDCNGNEIATDIADKHKVYLCGVSSKYFIGDTFDATKIFMINYTYVPTSGGMIVSIVFSAEYYNELLGLLDVKLDKNKAYINDLGYNEITWYANPSRDVHTCVDEITLSKRKRYSESLNGKMCYLTIYVRGKNQRTH